jgi:hypothetical protein
MGKIYQFIDFLGRSTTTSNSDNYPNVNNIDRLSPHVDRGQWLQIKLKQSIVPDPQLRIDFDRVDRNIESKNEGD